MFIYYRNNRGRRSKRFLVATVFEISSAIFVKILVRISEDILAKRSSGGINGFINKYVSENVEGTLAKNFTAH